MIGRPPRLGAVVRTGRDQRDVAADHDPVQPDHRPLRVEAPPGRREPVAVREIEQAPPMLAPLVEVAHQHPGRIAFALVQRLDDRPRLPPAPQSGQVQMHAHDPQRGSVHPKVGKHRAARLQRRQLERLATHDLDVLLHQQRVAVPANTVGPDIEVHRLVGRPALDHRQRDGARPRSEPPVRLLQRDDVRVDLAQHLQYALGPPQPISADRLAHVVGSDGDHRASFAGAGRRRSTRWPANTDYRSYPKPNFVIPAKAGPQDHGL
ncbi:MAG: hypothetical protein AVDCRST_MAG91-2575 [uncultured Sphingomonadaceae bacterium]|uniref:Uncharacterized protein n=1 Tax=uncultured Sphingomonadaceae bacterium TaxID=169976 RepID=A0A6J4TLE6_9SPHN|nr:MAG: hypothetical protein AVDCRST_MAG91-2575 [uncultured Sphingomonadaceae bacterium]